MISDESTSDSDSGIRFKTDSTRREKEEEANLERNRNKGRDNRRNFSPDRRREGFNPGNRDRNDRRPFNARDRSPLRDRGAPFRDRQRSPVRERPRSPVRDRPRSPVRDRPRSPIKERERSPFRDKGRNDRSSRDERKPRDMEQHRLPRSDGNEHNRSAREKPNDVIRPSGDVGGSSRNGSKGDNHSSRPQALPKNDRTNDSKSKRDTQKLYDRSQRFSDRDKDVSEAELKRKEESRRRLDDRHERSRSSHVDIKERLNIKRDDKHSEERSGVRNSSTRSGSVKQDKEKEKTLSRQHSSNADQSKSKVSSESRAKSSKEVSIDKERESSTKPRVKSPITFSKSSSKEVEKIGKHDKAPVEIQREPVKAETSKKSARKSVSPELEPEDVKQDVSDTEAKPVSYYNMISDVPNVNDVKTAVVDPSDEPIAVSDSSGDEAALRRKLLLLEKELKKTKVKRKSKHKDKKGKKLHKKSKSSSKDSDTPSNSDRSTIKIHSLPDESMSMKVTIRSNPSSAIASEKRIVSQANVSGDIDPKLRHTNLEISDDEEGEIFSDGEPVEAVDTSDLRHRLGRQIGPTLPTIAGAKSKTSADLRERLSSRTVLEGVSGPALPPHMRGKDDDEDATEVEGPALPPHLVKPAKDSNTKTMGPTLPADMREKLTKPSKADATINVDSDTEQHTDDTDEEVGDVVGPLPPGSEKLLSSAAHRKLEERALKMKIGTLEGYDDKDVLADKREEWMLELPDVKAANLGLGPRQFRARAGPDLSDRTSWTDTPELKALKAAGVPVVTKESESRDIQRDGEAQFIQQRDAEQELAVKKHKKKTKRNESLVEIHEKKLEKKRKKERKDDDGSKRRPFDRDIDLKANKFDEAQKKSIMKKAQLLDTRFSSGESKFL